MISTQSNDSNRMAVSRNIHEMTLQGPVGIDRDPLVNHAIASFGFLIGMREVIPFTVFADRIESYSSSDQAKAIAIHLRKVSSRNG